jgi:hypothetical protein
MRENKAGKDRVERLQQSPPPKLTGAPDCPHISPPTCTFSPSAPQIENFMLDSESTTGPIQPFAVPNQDIAYTTEDHNLRPHKRSIARGNSFIIPDSATLSESDEDEVGLDSRQVYVIPIANEASKPPFVKKNDRSKQIHLDLYVPITKKHLAISSLVQISPSLSTLFVHGHPGVRVEHNKRLNCIAKASSAAVVRSDDDVPDVINASSADDSAR